jgi:iron-sulfur cluster repair protein YtfE (RIC family)
MTVLIDLLDDDTRPRAARIEGVTARQRRHGKRLAMIHGLHLEQMDQVREIMKRIEAGEAKPAELSSAVSSMQMMANYQLFGNLCGRECRNLTFHHTAEDQIVFPSLAGRNEGLTTVIERLAAEHRIIHQLLVQLEASVVEATETPGRESFMQLGEIFDRLDRVVRSHFDYEQNELEEAIGYFNVPMG